MLGKIIEIKDKEIIISLDIDISSQTNLINLHVIFEEEKQKTLWGFIVGIFTKKKEDEEI